MELSDAPATLSNWIDRLKYAPKRLYAERFAAFRLDQSNRPRRPDTPWARLVEQKVDRYLSVPKSVEDVPTPTRAKQQAPKGKAPNGGKHFSTRKQETPAEPSIDLSGAVVVAPAVRAERLEHALVPGRARFALISSGLGTLGDLHGRTWSDLASLDGLGAVGLQNLAVHIELLNRRYGASEILAEGEGASVALAEEPDPAEKPAQGSWTHTAALLRTLITAAGEFSSAESVWDALADLQGLARQCGFEQELTRTAIKRIASGVGFAARANDEADDFVRELSDRERRILEERLLSNSPVTFDALGAEFGVTRERVRQLQARMEEDLARRLSPHVGSIANVLRARMGPVVVEQSLTDIVGMLFGDVMRPGTPLVRRMVMDSLGYAIVEGVGMDSEATAVADALKAAAVTLADSVGLVVPEELQAVLPEGPWIDHWEALLRRAGLSSVFSHLALRKTARASIMAAVLEAGHPVTPDEIAELTAIDAKTVRATFAALEVMARVDKTRWWLREWIEDEYEGIAAEIMQRIQEDGGGTPLARLLQELPERFGVTESSVRAFVGAPQFAVKDGFVGLADLASYRYRDLEDVIDGRTADGAPFWAFTVKRQYLEGYSLIGLPPELVRELGCGPNESIETPLRQPAGCRNLTVSWRASTPGGTSLGYLADPLRKLQIAVGDDACLICFGDGSVALRRHPSVTAPTKPDPEKGKRSRGGLEAADDLLAQLKRRRRVL